MEIRSGSDYHWISETAPLTVSQSWPWDSQIANKKLQKFFSMVFETFVKEFTYIQKRYFKNASTLTERLTKCNCENSGLSKIIKT